MSQPPKSTILAPAARWIAFSGVVLGKGLSRRKNKKGRGGHSASPRLSVYLRDCGAVSRRCPFGGPSPPTARSLSRSELRPRSPCCLSDCGSCAFGGGDGPGPSPHSPARTAQEYR